jgi:hypothetical protein
MPSITPHIEDERLPELLDLIEGADSVELKLTVPESDQRSAAEALGMDALDAHVRLVHFFDTPDLALFEHGVVVRARRVQGRHDDAVVKLRPVAPSQVSRALRRSPAFSIEVDAMPGGYVCSASLKGAPVGGGVKAVATGDRPIRKLFSKEQQAFYTAHAPDGIGLDDLTVLGPINLMKLKFSPRGYGRRLVAELWLYPDGSRILELSTKCAPAEAFDVAAETRAFLSSQGVDLSGEQQTKTKTALEFFSRNLKAAAGA